MLIIRLASCGFMVAAVESVHCSTRHRQRSEHGPESVRPANKDFALIDNDQLAVWCLRVG